MPPSTTRTDASSTPGLLEDPTGWARELAGALHDRLWQAFDGASFRSRRLREAAGGPDSFVVRAARPSGWATVVGMLCVAWSLVAQGLAMGRLASEGSVDLLAGRLPVLIAVGAFTLDVLVRLGGEPLVAVGRAGVAIGVPLLPTPAPGGPPRRIVLGASRTTPPAVDLVPWSDVAALVQLRGAHRTMPDLAELGVRLRRPLPAPWPHPSVGGSIVSDAEQLGLGTSHLTRPVAVLTGRRLAALVAAVGRHSPGTVVEDLPVREAVRLARR